MARYSFSRSIPPKFEHKLCHHKQSFGKITTTIVLDKEENWRKKVPYTILEEQFPVPQNIAASEIGNGIVSLLRLLRCHYNPNHNKFSSLSNTTVVAIFLTLCLWRRSLCSNLEDIDPEKLTVLSHLTWVSLGL